MAAPSMRGFAFVCVVVLGLPSCLASSSSSFRRATKTKQPLDPEIAEAEALASRVEAEYSSVPDVTAQTTQDVKSAEVLTAAPTVDAAVHDHHYQHHHHHRHNQHHEAQDEATQLLAATPAPQPSKAPKHHQGAVPAVLSHGSGADHTGSAVRAVKRSLPKNVTKRVAKAAMPPEAKLAKAKPLAHASVHGDAAANAVVASHHSTGRAAVHAVVKEVMPSKRTRETMRRLPKDVSKHVEDRILPVAATPSKSHAPPGLESEDENDEQPDYAVATGKKEDLQDFGQVEPGLAYGHGQPHMSPSDREALEEARKLEEEEERAKQARELEEAEAMMPIVKPSVGAKKRRVLHEVEELEEMVAEETKSKSLAYMLSGVKMDLYQLNEKMDILQKDVEDGVPLDPELIDESLVYPLSACMRCIFMLSAQYFILYAAVAVCRIFVDMFGLGEECIAQKALRAACDSVLYAPMLCVLFIGAHLRASQITLGKRGPQEWAETAMQICAWSCLIQTLMVLAIPIFTTTSVKPRRSQVFYEPDASRAIQDNSARGGGNDEPAGFASFLTFIRYISLLCLYVGFTMVCAAVILMDARSLGAKPLDLWDDPRTARTEYAPPVSVAMRCTIALTLFFFVVHLVHGIVWSVKELSQGGAEHGTRVFVASLEECLRDCTSAVNLAPMLCILFIAARMRALQMDPKWGRPQSWAEACFYVCVGSIMTQTLLIFIAKFSRARSVASARGPGDVATTAVRRLVLGLSYIVMGVTYAACGVVMVSVVLIKAKDGHETPPLSPAMLCVMFLVTLYLGVYLCLFVAQVANEEPDPARAETLQHVLATLKMAENTVKFGPMLAVLFVAARMRALQMTYQKGSPQCWAQDSMYIACGALLFQLAMVIASGFLSTTMEVDETGTFLTTKIRYLPRRIFLECLKMVTYVALFGGILSVVASILIIRPETAQCAKRGFSHFAN